METSYVVTALAIAFVALGFNGAPLWSWTLWAGALLWTLQVPVWAWAVFGAVAVVFNIPAIRRTLITSSVFKMVIKLKIFPTISETEQVALKAGDVWVEGELFSGKPNFKNLMNEKYPHLTADEKAFLDGPVEKACQMADDWLIWKHRDLSPELWTFLKKEGFFGMIIPKSYGGLGLSALAHSEVIAKLATRSLPLSTTVVVPNSLGPAELLLHYGTEEQKNYYLPRLARGEEMPCFALTEPGAGSDAASIQANGTVFKGTDGKLYLKLNWNKRWITLAAISTVIGLAFRLRDPDNLLGGGVDRGITCALVPRNTQGVTATHRHDPLGVPFYNCPTQGKDVVVPIDAIIGGAANAGKGWKMLMECLAAGRGISLPAQATGGTKFVARVASAHATVRKQFGLSIGKFEGICDPLAKITGFSYILEAGRRYTCGALDSGRKPPVITAIMKYNYTEIGRQVVAHGMDILGGAGISRGPHNLLAHGYVAAPIAVTVEGANILTRTLIIFGQGALRAHPFAYKEVSAVEENDLKKFDHALFGHIGHVIRNKFRVILLTLTRGWLSVPYAFGPTARYYRKLTWTSANFALLADIAMGGLGGKLKTKGKTTGRFADILSWMYLATATLKRFEAEGRKAEDLPVVHWALEYAFAQIQQAFDAMYASFDVPLIGWLFRGPIRWLSAVNPIGSLPTDSRDFAVAALIQRAGEQRDRITDGIYIPRDVTSALGRLENAFNLTLASEEVSSKVRKAVRKKLIQKKKNANELNSDALKAGVITQPEFDIIDKAEKARWEAIQVDDFSLPEYFGAEGVADGESGTGVEDGLAGRAMFAAVASYYDEAYSAKPELQDVAMYKAFAKRFGGPILEIGCGTGRVLIPIAKMNLEITGIDISDPMLAVLQSKLSKEDPAVRSKVQFRNGDMRNLSLEKTFPLVTIPFRSIQHMLTLKDKLDALSAAKKHLAPGGRLIFDAAFPKFEALATGLGQEYLDTEWTSSSEKGKKVRMYFRRDGYRKSDQVMLGSLIFRVFDGVDILREQEQPLAMHFYSLPEFEALFSMVGLNIEEAYGSYDLKPLDESATQMVFILSKS